MAREPRGPYRPGLSSGTGVLARLRAIGLAPRRRLGQHFLHDPALLAFMVEAAGVGPDDSVFEVGTGPATLTRVLARRARRVVSVEVDRRLAAFARSELSGAPNVEILVGDVLERKSCLHPAVAARLEQLGPFAWVSNLPYSVATPLVLLLLESGLSWTIAVLTLQLEVARKLCAGPGESDYGTISALAAYWCRGTVLRRVPAGSFWPAPRVESAMVMLRPRPPLGDPPVFAEFRGWVRAAFGARRKQLEGILRRELGAPRAAEALRLGGWEPTARPETLGAEDFLLLAESFPRLRR